MFILIILKLLTLFCFCVSMLNTGPDYLPILFSASILPESGSSEAIHDAIISFMDEKKEWLQKWQDVMTRDYDGVEHDIDPEGLDLAKLGEGGNVMTDGCNGARKFNRLMVETINKLYKERGSLGTDVIEESIGTVIVQSIADAAVQSQNEEEGMDNQAAGDEEDSDGSNDDDDSSSVLSDASDSTTVPSSDPVVAMESYCHHHIRMFGGEA